MTLSEKIVSTLSYETDDEQIKEVVEIIKEYPSSTIIISILVSIFISIYIVTLIDVLTLSVFGLFTCFVAKIKMNYKAVFNMSIFALTLSIILRTIYIIINILTSFEIKYFNVMYVAISYISLAAAIFLIKSDVIKQQLQLMKIIEQSKEKIEETITIPRRPKEDEETEKDNQEKKDKDKDEKKGTEEQGSNA